MRQLSSAPDGREIEQLFRTPVELVDRHFGNALVECLRIAEMIRCEPQTFMGLQYALGCSARTLRRHLARLRRAGYGIRFRYDLNAYVSTGLDWSQPRRTA